MHLMYFTGLPFERCQNTDQIKNIDNSFSNNIYNIIIVQILLYFCNKNCVM